MERQKYHRPRLKQRSSKMRHSSALTNLLITRLTKGDMRMFWLNTIKPVHETVKSVKSWNYFVIPRAFFNSGTRSYVQWRNTEGTSVRLSEIWTRQTFLIYTETAVMEASLCGACDTCVETTGTLLISLSHLDTMACWRDISTTTVCLQTPSFPMSTSEVGSNLKYSEIYIFKKGTASLIMNVIKYSMQCTTVSIILYCTEHM